MQGVCVLGIIYLLVLCVGWRIYSVLRARRQIFAIIYNIYQRRDSHGARDNCLHSQRKNCEKYMYNICIKKNIAQTNMQIGKSVKIPVCNVDVSRLLSFRLHTECFFIFRIHLHSFSESEMKTHGKLIALRLILLLKGAAGCPACCSLTNLYQHTNIKIYDNVLPRR